jgi:hypothetical protein
VDLAHSSECTKPEDKLRILADVKHSVGLKRMHETLKGSVEKVARATLRWGNMKQLSAFCALLLEVIWSCCESVLPDLYHHKKLERLYAKIIFAAFTLLCQATHLHVISSSGP